MITMFVRRRALTIACALLGVATQPVLDAAAQTPTGSRTEKEFTAHDANAQARVLALADEVIVFTGEGYKTVPSHELLARLDGYRDRMRTLAIDIADTPAAATLAMLLSEFEQLRTSIAAMPARQGAPTAGGADTPRTGNGAGSAKLRALLAELTAANGYADLPTRQRLAALDAYLSRLQALGPEVAGTAVAAIHERVLREGRQERADVAAKLDSNPAGTQGVAEGAYTDFEWMGQRAVMALTNPLQREDFRASLARGIDFNVGVSTIERDSSGWMVQLSGRLGNSGTPGQGFFCRVEPSDTSSLAVLRGITPPYGIVHMTASRVDTFTLQSNPLRIRIVFEGCRITPQSTGSKRQTDVGPGVLNRSPRTAVPAEQAQLGSRANRVGAPVAPSPAGMRCATDPPRNEPQRAMARRVRQAWDIPEALRADPTLTLTFAVTLNFDAELQGAPQLVKSQSRRATSDQMNAAIDAADTAIRETAPFPELGQFAGGTMQIDMTPCD